MLNNESTFIICPLYLRGRPELQEKKTDAPGVNPGLVFFMSKCWLWEISIFLNIAPTSLKIFFLTRCATNKRITRKGNRERTSIPELSALSDTLSVRYKNIRLTLNRTILLLFPLWLTILSNVTAKTSHEHGCYTGIMIEIIEYSKFFDGVQQGLILLFIVLGVTPLSISTLPLIL